MRLKLIGAFMLLHSVVISQINVEAFIPEVFSEMPYVRDLAISTDGREMYFTVDDYKHTIGFITCIKKKRKKWSDPEVVSFSGQYRDIEPFLSPDGKRLYFASNRPADDSQTSVKDYDIWYVERKDAASSWSEPIWLGLPVNSEADEYYPSLTLNGDLYFTAEREGSIGKEDIFMAEYEDGKYLEPKSVQGGANHEGYEFNAFVAPDASYIIFTSYRSRDGRNRNDLYISMKKDNGDWGEATLIPGIHSNAIDYCPFVDVKSNKLYFTSERKEIPTHFDQPLNYDQFMSMLRTLPNGHGRIYVVDLAEVINQTKIKD